MKSSPTSLAYSLPWCHLHKGTYAHFWTSCRLSGVCLLSPGLVPEWLSVTSQKERFPPWEASTLREKWAPFSSLPLSRPQYSHQ